MLVLNLFQWWYSRGWALFTDRLKERLRKSLDFFSVGSLLRTLFSPFRQIDAGGSGPRAFFDSLFSRLIGAMIRIFILIFGTIILALESVVGIALLILWPFIPLAPVAGIVLTVMQVTF